MLFYFSTKSCQKWNVTKGFLFGSKYYLLVFMPFIYQSHIDAMVLPHAEAIISKLATFNNGEINAEPSLLITADQVNFTILFLFSIDNSNLIFVYCQYSYISFLSEFLFYSMQNTNFIDRHTPYYILQEKCACIVELNQHITTHRTQYGA